MSRKLNYHRWIIVSVLLCLWGVLLFQFNDPFFGHREGDYAWVSATFRAFKQYGASELGYLPVWDPGPITPDTADYYMHHPPFKIWFNVLAIELFGYHTDTFEPYETSFRVFGSLTMMLHLCLFYVLARRLMKPHVAMIAFLLYVLAPVTLYFGRFAYYDTLQMPVILAFAYVFVLWMQEYSHQRTILLVILGSFAMWIDWPPAFYFATFGIIALIYGRKPQRIGIVFIGIIVGLMTAAIPLLYVNLNSDALVELQSILISRTVEESITFAEYTPRFIGHMIQMLSIGTFLFGLMGIGMVARRKPTFTNAMIMSFIIAPFVFMLIARSAWHFHDWYKIHYLPGFAILSAIAITTLHASKPKGLMVYAKPTVFALVVCSVVASIYLFVNLRTSISHEWGDIVTELSASTQVEDTIASNRQIPITPVEFYAYRNVLWGVDLDEVLATYTEAETLDVYYLLELTPEIRDVYSDILATLDYTVITDDYYLIHFSKP